MQAFSLIGNACTPFITQHIVASGRLNVSITSDSNFNLKHLARKPVLDRVYSVLDANNYCVRHCVHDWQSGLKHMQFCHHQRKMKIFGLRDSYIIYPIQ